MTYELVSVLCGGEGPQQSYLPDANPKLRLNGWYDNANNDVSPCAAYQNLYEESKSDSLFYCHDDVMIHERGWQARVKRVFEEHDDCVCVGFGGATQLGHDDLYKTRFQINHMARQGYVSNQTDWQTHGALEKGDKQVAVVDAFFMAVRTDFLRLVRGWPVAHLTHHCLDLWLACEAARHKKQVWMTGVHCTHHGGGSSTKPVYQKAKWLQGRTLEKDHQNPHRWLYEQYSDVLPIKVKGENDD